MTPTLLVHAQRIIGPSAPGSARATSVAVAGDRIVALGSRSQIARMRSRSTAVLDRPDAVLMPGFIDAHTHFHNWACRSDIVDLVGLTSLAAALKRLAAAARQRKPGQWLVARGFDKNHWHGAFPTAADLDAVTGPVPTQVNSRDGHTMWVNSAALRAAGITTKTQAPAGGTIARDPKGRPTGILQENAITLLPDVQSTLSDDQIERALRRGIAEAHRLGITTVHSVEESNALRWFQRLHRDGKLTLRIRYAIPGSQLEHAVALGLTNGFGDDVLRISAVKIFSDGALGSQTAWMFDAYPTKKRDHGVPVTIGKALRDLVCNAARAGLPSWVHAIGDRANHEVLGAFAAARRVEPTPLAHRIEHAQCVRPADVKLMARLNVIASMQPCHIVGDIGAAELHWANVLPWTYPVRALRDAGVLLAFGSDIPVETFDPIVGLHAAVNRTALDGTPNGGWLMHNAVPVRDAIAAYTAGGAAAADGDAKRLGRIAPGYLADLALLSDNPLRMPADRLLDLRVAATVWNGQVVYEGDRL